MLESEFKDMEKDQTINDVDWINFYYPFTEIFKGKDNATIISDNEVAYINSKILTEEERKKPTFILKPNGFVEVLKNNEFNFAVGAIISKFMLWAAIQFNNDSNAAMSHAAYYVRKKTIPYIRVGTDYLHVIRKENRYGYQSEILKPWTKEAISDDHGKHILKSIPRYNDFIIVPDNTLHRPSYDRCYNLYSPFPHTPHDEKVEIEDIPNTAILLTHIFGEQLEVGVKYMKVLYELPKQILPVLTLVSEERETGKTTFLNWIQMVFGENSVLISPHELTSSFNAGYATKNIILIDETVLEKSTSVEKLKSLATAKTISVSQKFVSQYSVPFFGKIIIATNKEKDFMKIDTLEVRFWVRKIKVIEGKKNVNIETDLFNEIPKFLKYLKQIDSVDLSNSRMVFTQEEINTKELSAVKDESKSWMHKELEILIDDFFMKHEFSQQFEATAKDIKEKWFNHNHQVTIAYVRKVLKHEMKIGVEAVKKYYPFNTGELDTGAPFVFKNPAPTKGQITYTSGENSPVVPPIYSSVGGDPDDMPF